MEFVTFSVTVTSLIHVLVGHKVPKLTVCSSMCTVKQDRFFFSVMCQTNMSNSFRVNTADQTSLTGKQMIYKISDEGISDANCENNDSFLAKTIYITCDRGTFSFDIKEMKWTKLSEHKFRHLRGDPAGKRVLGLQQTSIIALKENSSTTFLHCDECPGGILDFDYDSNSKEAFTLHKHNKIFRMKKDLPKILPTNRIRALRLDQKNRKIYLLTIQVFVSNLVCLSYNGTMIQIYHIGTKQIRFMGHFDTWGSRVLARSGKRKRFLSLPDQETTSLPIKYPMDIDYDDEYVYVLGQRGGVKKIKRGESVMKVVGSPRRSSLGYSIAVA